LSEATQDDIGLFWLADQSQADIATTLLKNLKNPAINEVLSGNYYNKQTLAILTPNS
jgi:hypothetical protein